MSIISKSPRDKKLSWRKKTIDKFLKNLVNLAQAESFLLER